MVGMNILTAKMMYFFSLYHNVFVVTCASGHQGEGIYFDGSGDKERHTVYTKKKKMSFCDHMEGVPRKLVGDRN